MPIRGVVLDVSKTLLSPRGEAVSGLGGLWSYCTDNGLRIIVASNQQTEVKRLRALGYEPDFVALPSNIGKRKPSGDFVTIPAERLGVGRNELVYLGDDDMTDAVCASHARVPYLRAAWAEPDGQYGIPLASLHDVVRYLRVFGTKQHHWFWAVDGCDSEGRTVTCRAMVDCRTIDPAQERVKSFARSVLKDGTTAYRPFFFNHLLVSLYFSGLADRFDLWTTYPSHNVGSTGQTVLAEFVGPVSQLFR